MLFCVLNYIKKWGDLIKGVSYNQQYTPRPLAGPSDLMSGGHKPLVCALRFEKLGIKAIFPPRFCASIFAPVEL